MNLSAAETKEFRRKVLIAAKDVGSGRASETPPPSPSMVEEQRQAEAIMAQEKEATA